jgi:hypothetical protein
LQIGVILRHHLPIAAAAGLIRAVKIGGKVIVPTDGVRRPVTPA